MPRITLTEHPHLLDQDHVPQLHATTHNASSQAGVAASSDRIGSHAAQNTKDLEWLDDAFAASLTSSSHQAELNRAHDLYRSPSAKYGREARELYQKLADQGNSTAQVFLGDMHETGRGGPTDMHKAFELYEKSAKQGNPEGQFRLGRMYEFGHSGLKKNHTMAVMLYEKSAAQGNPHAQVLLGSMYESGDDGLPRDLNKALELYTKSAAQRDPSGVMQFNRLIKTRGRKPHLFTS